MEHAKNIKLECSSHKLMSFYIQQMFSLGNNGLAKRLGIHPSKSSRDKNRIFELACLLVTEIGLPPESVNISDKPTKVVLEGDYAERVIQALEGKGKIKKRASAVATNETQMSLL